MARPPGAKFAPLRREKLTDELSLARAEIDAVTGRFLRVAGIVEHGLVRNFERAMNRGIASQHAALGSQGELGTNRLRAKIRAADNEKQLQPRAPATPTE